MPNGFRLNQLWQPHKGFQGGGHHGNQNWLADHWSPAQDCPNFPNDLCNPGLHLNTCGNWAAGVPGDPVQPRLFTLNGTINAGFPEIDVDGATIIDTTDVTIADGATGYALTGLAENAMVTLGNTGVDGAFINASSTVMLKTEAGYAPTATVTDAKAIMLKLDAHDEHITVNSHNQTNGITVGVCQIKTDSTAQINLAAANHQTDIVDVAAASAFDLEDTAGTSAYAIVEINGFEAGTDALKLDGFINTDRGALVNLLRVAGIEVDEDALKLLPDSNCVFSDGENAYASVGTGYCQTTTIVKLQGIGQDLALNATVSADDAFSPLGGPACLAACGVDPA